MMSDCVCVFAMFLNTTTPETVWDTIIKFYWSKIQLKPRTSSKMGAIRCTDSISLTVLVFRLITEHLNISNEKISKDHMNDHNDA